MARGHDCGGCLRECGRYLVGAAAGVGRDRGYGRCLGGVRAASGAGLPQGRVSRPVPRSMAAPRGPPLTWTPPERGAAPSAPEGGSGRRGRGTRAPHGRRPWTAPSWRVRGRRSRGALSADWLPRRKCPGPGLRARPEPPFPLPPLPRAPGPPRARTRPGGCGSVPGCPSRPRPICAGAVGGRRRVSRDPPPASPGFKRFPSPWGARGGAAPAVPARGRPNTPAEGLGSRCLLLRLGLPGLRERAGPSVCPRFPSPGSRTGSARGPEALCGSCLFSSFQVPEQTLSRDFRETPAAPSLSPAREHLRLLRNSRNQGATSPLPQI